MTNDQWQMKKEGEFALLLPARAKRNWDITDQHQLNSMWCSYIEVGVKFFRRHREVILSWNSWRFLLITGHELHELARIKTLDGFRES